MPSLDLSDKSILLVDDVSFSRATLASILSYMGKPLVHQAPNGAVAMEVLCNQSKIELIISDFKMPVMHGLQLLQAVRTGQQKVPRNIPFAMVTGYSEQALVDSALSLDVNAFLIKPVSKKGLERRLQSMLKLVSGDEWLKSANSYRDVDVDSKLAMDYDIDQDSDSAFFARGVLLKSDVKSENRAKPHSGKIDSGEKNYVFNSVISRECQIQDVPGNSILAKDIHSAEGRKLLSAGVVLTPHKLSLLNDLQQLGNPVEYIWIEK